MIIPNKKTKRGLFLSKVGLKTLFQSILIFFLYILTARIGLALDPVSGFATLVWAPSGIALAAMLLIGYKAIPAIFLGAFVANFTTGAPLLVSLSIGLGNTLESFIALYVLRGVSFRNSLDRLRDAWSLILFGAILSPIVAATIGTSSLILGGVSRTGMFTKTWVAWWVGDMLGILIITPLILSWLASSGKNKTKLFQAFEFMLVFLIFLVVCWILFEGFLGVAIHELPIDYVIFPILIWVTLRFKQREVVSLVFILAIIAIWGTSEGYGTFARGKLSESLLFLQSFIAITSGIFLLFSSTMAEKNSLERRKNDFISIASHELKTPLTSIKGYVQIFKQLNKDKKIEPYAAKLEDQINRLTILINQMLDSSRIGEDKLALNYETFNLNELLKQIAQEYRRLNKTHLVQYTTKSATLIEADQGRLRQVIENLISNAIKFSPGSKKVVLDLSVKKDYVIISVKDFGVGIDLKDQRDIFNRFFQADNSSKAAISGLGLGLYISSGIIRKHHGLIWVISREGKGSTFYTQLPLAAK